MRCGVDISFSFGASSSRCPAAATLSERPRVPFDLNIGNAKGARMPGAGGVSHWHGGHSSLMNRPCADIALVIGVARSGNADAADISVRVGRHPGGPLTIARMGVRPAHPMQDQRRSTRG